MLPFGNEVVECCCPKCITFLPDSSLGNDDVVFGGASPKCTPLGNSLCNNDVAAIGGGGPEDAGLFGNPLGNDEVAFVG